MCFALFMMMLDNTVVNVALPSIQRSLHASLSALEWTINAYTLTLAVLLVTGGRLGDIFGRRRIFLIGVLIFGVSSADSDACRSRWIDGSATFTTVLSSMLMNSAKHIAPSVHQRLFSSVISRRRWARILSVI